MKKYYIYHIPTFVHKSGKIGKIGCSEEAEVRVLQQGYTDFEIIEEHTDIMIASDREIELQKQYGYAVDSCPYYITRQMPTKEGCKKGGDTAGKINAEKEGYMAKLGSISASKQWKENREHELKKCSKGGKSNAEKTSKITIMCDLDGNQIIIFKSRKEAANHVNGNGPTIKAVIDNPNRTYKGYKWKNG
jgi:hypothetical protein